MAAGETPRPAPDWSLIEDEYRQGVKSYRQIGRDHGVNDRAIRKRAEKYGWQRDLTDKIRTATRAKLALADAAAEVRANPALHQAEIVEAGSQMKAGLVQGHRRRITRLCALGDKIVDRLEVILDPEFEGTPGIAIGDKETPAQLLGKLTSITQTLIALEREVYGLNDPAETAAADGSTPALDALMSELRAQRKRLEETQDYE